MMALVPEAHTLFTVVHTQVLGMPAASAACRAGACPTLPVSTLPTNTSCTSPGATRARASASRMAAAPSCGAVSEDSAPLMLPMGVRAEPQMNTSREPMAAAGWRQHPVRHRLLDKACQTVRVC
jgi:hypothetical protein